MLKHAWSIINLGSVIDADNSLQVGRVLENVTINLEKSDLKKEDIPKGVIIPINFEITSLFYNDVSSKKDKTIEIKIVIRNNTGKVINEAIQKVNFPANTARLRVRGVNQNVVFNELGTQTYEIHFRESAEKNFVKATEIPLFIGVE